MATRSTILRCVGESALHADPKDLLSKVNEMTQKFVMPALQVRAIQVQSTSENGTSEIGTSEIGKGLKSEQKCLPFPGLRLHEKTSKNRTNCAY